MRHFDNKLNPLPVVLSIITTLTSDDFLSVVQEAGVSINLTLTEKEDFSNKTRLRVYLPRVNEFILNLDDEQALNVIYLLTKALISKEPQKKDELTEKLRSIGWDLVGNTISPVDSEVIELFFEKGLVHSAYQKIRDIIHSSTTSIYIMDGYVDNTIFELFKIFDQQTISVKLLTLNLYGDYAHEKTLFLQEHSNLTIEEKITRDIHDRFIIIDEKEVYHLGASIKDAGKKVFMINKIEDESIANNIIQSFLTRFV